VIKAKIWVFIYILISFSIVTLIGLFNFIVDPFQQYRTKTFYPLIYTNERYRNAGFLKNFQYDGIVLGTSMTENFKIKEVESSLDLDRVLKLSISGASAREQSIVLNSVLDNNKDLKEVLWGLDVFSFIGDKKRLAYGKDSFPFYLYDNNIINDYKYLISLDTSKESLLSLLRIVKPKNHHVSEYNLMHEWQYMHEDEFGRENVIKKWKERKTNFNNKKVDEQRFEVLKESFDFNFKKLIKNTPDIQYIVFFPPYSILAFKAFEEKGVLEDVLRFKSYLYEELSKLDNVKLYDFQIDKNITHEFKNYKDLTHYHQDINTCMSEQIEKENYLINSNNADMNSQRFKNQILNYKGPKYE